jgi:hypothetical protein
MNIPFDEFFFDHDVEQLSRQVEEPAPEVHLD